MDNDFVQLLNRKGDIKVYKNSVISSNPLHLYEECSYYDEKVYNVFDLLNKLEEKDKEIERTNSIIDELDAMFDGDLDGFFTINEKGSCNEIIGVIQNYKNKLKELKEGK